MGSSCSSLTKTDLPAGVWPVTTRRILIAVLPVVCRVEWFPVGAQRAPAPRSPLSLVVMQGTYGVEEFVDDARKIMEVPGGAGDREAAVRALEPLLRTALDGPGWTDPRYATTVEGGRRGFAYYRNDDGTLFVYGVLFRQGHPTPVHDHVTWGIIGVHSGEQRTARYRRRDDGSVPGRCSVELRADEVLTHGATYPLLPPHDI